MLNLLTTITNFTSYYPIRRALLHGDWITALIISFAAMASAVSHLFESHKHQMTGFGTDPKISYLLNRVDVLAVIMTLGRVLYLWYWGHFKILEHLTLLFSLILAWGCNLISESDPGYTYYLPFHCVWHLSIFLILDRYLEGVY